MPNGKADEVWFVYLLRCADGTLYCGVTNNIERRLTQHHRGRGARYTRGRAPFILLGHAPFPGRGEAQRVEYRIKRQPTDQKLACLATIGGDAFVAGALQSAPAEGITWNP
ncbi:GIY-YIG nuclease family protein [Nitratidesulfovibrio vulgaris]|jgi:putative endonuclease|uniref:UPF0213 protein DVU_3309 n=1 Tax=Nitratidesulfovibrio vulgaris (strain ATCC 29579 / DSM 644 / CCUG 34227 / NCIMB 8303 / VKM B-1760 / Hildenborough) TaxID=882 RepID=Y3309_NITV2|nr:GIY-YIG nuclease family protein [Nitratidesulfovibrio vulgaris]Q725W6.1 RecName: Full=UPF0213 protein DVU_3309 [Nitratidesulfovibrio vulgaris str. Hildenborough]AAS97777.1 endo/excinuclease amino terminal domain protein [Nitratidesulfovibrio vulgaris str. Hildenborough]ADP88199.1 Excinuclease ABC C subunit domain protein [Nitratidesulfovibrio vulgaris RCH1]HBW14994.1 GIY-YIG nuclease family protein [Desulfovibrio sp.]